jgi:hypothetical protein
MKRCVLPLLIALAAVAPAEAAGKQPHCRAGRADWVVNAEAGVLTSMPSDGSPY